MSWQPVLTDHQAYTYEALAEQTGLPFTAFVTDMEDATRKAQGWTDAHVTHVNRHQIPHKGFLTFCYRELKANPDAIHIFGSPFQDIRLMMCWLMAGWLNVEFYLISEPYSPIDLGYLSESSRFRQRLKACLRPYIYWVYAHLLRTRTAGIFAISRRALEQFRKAGMPAGKLFPFGYFVPSSVLTDDTAHANALSGEKPLRLIFVGSLLLTKGIDLLHQAATRLAHESPAITIDIYGPGDFSAYDEEDKTGWRYGGSIPFGQAQSVMAGYDALVLPSRYDGWGVVVNEALCAGIPVVCSDQAGAGILLETFDAGLTFPTGDVKALCRRLLELRDQPERRLALKTGARLAAHMIQPENAARYMWAVMQATPDQKCAIPSPWYA